MFSSKDGSTGRRANGIGHTRIGKSDPSFAVDRCLEFAEVNRGNTNGLVGMIIRHNEQDVGFVVSLILGEQPTKEETFLR